MIVELFILVLSLASDGDSYIAAYEHKGDYMEIAWLLEQSLEQGNTAYCVHEKEAG